MSDQLPDDKAEGLELIRKSFPDLRCLRCGHDNFLIFQNIKEIAGLRVVLMACDRCGHIEQHLLGSLRQAEKPIPVVIDAK